MDGFILPVLAPVAKKVGIFVAAAAIAVAGIGYAVHERHSEQATAAQNAQMTAQLIAKNNQIDALMAKMNTPAPSIMIHNPLWRWK